MEWLKLLAVETVDLFNELNAFLGKHSIRNIENVYQESLSLTWRDWAISDLTDPVTEEYSRFIRDDIERLNNRGCVLGRAIICSGQLNLFEDHLKHCEKCKKMVGEAKWLSLMNALNNELSDAKACYILSGGDPNKIDGIPEEYLLLLSCLIVGEVDDRIRLA